MPNLHFIHPVLAPDVKMLPCGPLQKPGGAEQSAFVPTFIRILKQANKQMQVWRSGGKVLAHSYSPSWTSACCLERWYASWKLRKDRDEAKENF